MKILLTDEEVQYAAIEGYTAVAQAQLKKVVGELEGQIGMYSRTADNGRVWLPIDEFRQALLKEVNINTKPLASVTT